MNKSLLEEGLLQNSLELEKVLEGSDLAVSYVFRLLLDFVFVLVLP